MRKLLLIALFLVSTLAFARNDENIIVTRGDCIGECRIDITELIQNPEVRYHLLNADQLHHYLLEHSPRYKESFKDLTKVDLKPTGEIDIELDYNPLQEGGDGNGGISGGI